MSRSNCATLMVIWTGWVLAARSLPDMGVVTLVPLASRATWPRAPLTGLVKPSVLGGYKSRRTCSPGSIGRCIDHAPAHSRIVRTCPASTPAMARSTRNFNWIAGTAWSSGDASNPQHSPAEDHPGGASHLLPFRPQHTRCRRLIGLLRDPGNAPHEQERPSGQFPGRRHSGSF
jgi:hypothetical protein